MQIKQVILRRKSPENPWVLFIRFKKTLLDVQEAWGLAHPGVYALVGSGAMLGGFTQMSGISESQIHGVSWKIQESNVDCKVVKC